MVSPIFVDGYFGLWTLLLLLLLLFSLQLLDLKSFMVFFFLMKHRLVNSEHRVTGQGICQDLYFLTNTSADSV